ncbi:MAG: DUF4382 domain-containing protein, partial [Saccharospirillaceae bacterium]|nr:DUF4382 domain-containing protein [Saccharospirillaceae bacterium]
MKKIYFSILVLALLLSACNNSTSNVTFFLTDAPVTNAENVYITISAITLKGPDGQQTITLRDEFDNPQSIQVDLLTLIGDQSIVIAPMQTLTAGEYQWIRLDVQTDEELDSYVVLDGGSVHELEISSGELKLVSGFTLPANGSIDLTIDIDLQKAMV